MSTEVKAAPSVHRFFSRHGALSKWHPNYESDRRSRHRHRQDAGLSGSRAAFRARVVVSTGTKALQEQLFFRDIPFLEKVFGRPCASAT
jgi:ATP-dependent DNA helicase DinG